MAAARRRLRVLLLHARSQSNRTLSYQHAWTRNFLRHPLFDCVPLNVARRGRRARLAASTRVRLQRFDAVVALHSVYSNGRELEPSLAAQIARLPVPKAFFVGNEHKLMPDKMRFCEELGVTLVVSQYTAPAVHALYRERLRCHAIGIPSAALDPDVFAPRVPWHERPIDIGYRAYDGPPYLGHSERRDIAEYFLEYAPAHGLTLDVSLDERLRFDEKDWAAFLNRCKGQIGTEAGGEVFELTDETRNAVNAHVREHPDTPMDEIRRRFFQHRPAVSGRMLSSRVVEAAGAKTVQILFEGAYSGFFEPDVHYIPLRNDFTNAEEAVAKLRDPATALALADAAYDVVRSELTYERLIARFHAALLAQL